MRHLDRLDPMAARRRSITLAVRVVLGLGLATFLAVNLLPVS